MIASLMATLPPLLAAGDDEFIGFVLAFAAGTFTGGFVMRTAMKRELAVFGILGAVLCEGAALGMKILFDAPPEKAAVVSVYTSLLLTNVVLLVAQNQKRAPIAKKLEEAQLMREEALKAAKKRTKK